MKRAPFDLTESPLEGVNLIEAAAGTGKTYTIAGLYLRLILEKALEVKNVLVVSFTEAATAELKQRIRSRLREAKSAFAKGSGSDPLLARLIEQCPSTEEALDRLNRSLRNFDQAAVFTIHGFCLRTLGENAFESGSLFDTELITDQSDIIREVIEDFWRRKLYNASPAFLRYVLAEKYLPDVLTDELSRHLTQPRLKVVPREGDFDTALLEGRNAEAADRVRQAWAEARAEVAEILLKSPALNRASYKVAAMEVLIADMDEFARSGRDGPFQGFEKLSSANIAAKTKKNFDAPGHPFFDLCRILLESSNDLGAANKKRLIGLTSELFQYARTELDRRKDERNARSFDDLLTRLQLALAGRQGRALAGAVREKYQAALIDEFQDTDPVQYEIFDRIFGRDRILFLIGDPKQAIFSFRNADVFAYMEAVRRAEHTYTLEKNWRTEPGLIEAANAVFSGGRKPFVFDEIPFLPASAPPDKDPAKAHPVTLNGEAPPPLKLWYMNLGRFGNGDKPIGKEAAANLISGAVCAEIARLIEAGRDGKALLAGRSLVAGDVAVLVRAHVDARRVAERLSTLNVPNVIYGAESIFASHEAAETLKILAALIEPNNETRIRTALATDVFGLNGMEIDRLDRDDQAREDRLLRFARYHRDWESGGFIFAFRGLMREEGVLARLMRFGNGERRCTNMIHLAEVLHRTAFSRALGLAALTAWLADRIVSDEAAEEHQLRLESDENAVKVVTIHKSKGLEYPVVFCPFLWGGSRIGREKNIRFHDQERRLTLDLGSDDLEEHRSEAETEELAENLRLTYVALTRAKSRCYLVWGRINQAESSAPAYLFHQPRTCPEDQLPDRVRERFAGFSDAEFLADLKELADRSVGRIELAPLPDEPGRVQPLPGLAEGTLEARRFTGRIDRSWRVSSFSSLVSGRHRGVDLPDVDQPIEERPLIDVEPPQGIFAFPKGTKAGLFMHAIFENLDFTGFSQPESDKLLEDLLRRHGFDLEWKAPVREMVGKVLTAPLLPDRPDFTLSRVPPLDRLNELEFYFPMNAFGPQALGRLLKSHAEGAGFGNFAERMVRLEFTPVRGFMKGFMDLVFRFEDRYWLVDWKSNYLGPTMEDYGPEAMDRAMSEEFYVLQYLIYTVALDRYLRRRIKGYEYERHFGGVCYLFLRGVDPERPESGIYHQRPPADLIERLAGEMADFPLESR